MSSKRDPGEFKIEVIKQLVDQGNTVPSVTKHLNIITRSLYVLIKKK
ncbi:hypothetical protein [Enterobacter asburiae]